MRETAVGAAACRTSASGSHGGAILVERSRIARVTHPAACSALIDRRPAKVGADIGVATSGKARMVVATPEGASSTATVRSQASQAALLET